MKRFFLLAAMALLPLLACAEGEGQRPLSDSAYASVLTCGAGDEFYTAFGHSAIRICDSARGVDLVYNYGTFDFDAPHFYWSFARGKLNYCLSRSSFADFVAEYYFEGRAVWEQRLRSLLDAMLTLFYRPEGNTFRDCPQGRSDRIGAGNKFIHGGGGGGAGL